MKGLCLICAALGAVFVLAGYPARVGDAEALKDMAVQEEALEEPADSFAGSTPGETTIPEAGRESAGETEKADVPESEKTPVPDASPDWFEEKGLTLGDSSVIYPALKEGVVSEGLREQINGQMLADGRIAEYATRVSRLISGGSLRVSWRGSVLGSVFSFAVMAEGAVENPRPTFVWSGGNIDLRDGHEIMLDELFMDLDGGIETVETYLEESVLPELSAHLLNSQLTPVPDLFRMTERGLIFMYPIEQLSTLSDRAGDVLVPWPVMREYLNLEENGILAAMNLTDWAGETEDIPKETMERMADRIRAVAAEGRIPGIPVHLGDSMQELTDDWNLLIDPDVYALGRFFSLEGAEFRNVFLMTDFLSESWENSAVDGIRVDCGSVFGLTVGETRQETWRDMLGKPDYTVQMDEEQAEAYRTVPGERDYYEMGGHRLQLHADAAGTLVSVILTE